ncbi:MAG: hypothetical protein K9I85_04550 [Saprospiraceae bacterium]|nr:hypothetical protein [Saprospiraceae bacterium]
MITITQPEQLNKVASITIFFWILEVLATTLGETLGDMLSMTSGSAIWQARV